jgi:shikimate kinase/3-dehydroquinate synthase
MILTGFMGSGKTSVGAKVSRLLGWSFLDLDEEIVREAGVPIDVIFREQGEAAFRAQEVALLKRVLAAGRSVDAGEGGLVLALGGGTLERQEARQLLEGVGPLVYLDVDADTAWQRVSGTGRPLAQERAQFAGLWASRRPRYLEAADWVFPTADRGVAESAADIADVVRITGRAWPTSWGRRLGRTGRASLIVGGPGVLAGWTVLAGRLRQAGARLFAVTDEQVQAAWGAELSAVLEVVDPDRGGSRVLVLPPGETTKDVVNLERCWEWLAAGGCRRDDVLLAFGGGVIGDLAGFAAATYQRGIKLWQVPTSLLAQVDSSVGGKTAINLSQAKNLVGAFYQPDLVVIDPHLLLTLPGPEYVNGLGEVVKYGLLIGPPLFDLLQSAADLICSRDPATVAEVVKRCVHYKAQVVENDERDTGERAVLNLGHTTGHALESALGYGSLGHGEAVGLGLLVALRVSESRLGLDPSVRRKTKALLQKLGLRTRLPLPPLQSLLEAVGRDKKVTAATSGFVGLRALGVPVLGLDISGRELAEALEVIAA